MKSVAFVGGLTVAVVALLSASGAAAANHNFVPEAARSIQGGRGLAVVIAQGEIKSDINPSNIAVAAGGGLLAALVDAKVNSDRAKRAEAEIVPVRAALTGYDVDSLATGATQAAVAKTAWFQAAPATLTRDSTIAGKVAVLDASTASQVGFFEYTYDLSPDFREIRVAVSMQFANKAVAEGKKPDARIQSGNLAYNQRITCVMSLPSPSKDIHQNAAQWSANDGRLARQALGQAFDEIGILIPRLLEVSEADVKAMGSRSKKATTVAGYFGAIQEQTPTETLLFNGVGLVDVKTVTD